MRLAMPMARVLVPALSDSIAPISSRTTLASVPTSVSS